jgi:hypothetical protein
MNFDAEHDLIFDCILNVYDACVVHKGKGS